MSAPAISPTAATTHRDPGTLGMCAVLCTWAWFLYSFNPAVPFLQNEMGLTAGQAGLDGTASAAGSVLAALVLPRLAGVLPRRWLLTGTLCLFGIGVAGLMGAHSLPWTLTGVLVLTIGGNASIAVANAGLVMRHGARSHAVIAEANGIAAALGVVATLTLAWTLGSGWGWQPAVAGGIAIAALAAVAVARYWCTDSPMDLPAQTPSRRRRPAPVAPPVRTRGVFIAYVVLLVCGIGLEFCTTYWGAGFVLERTGASAGLSTAIAAGFLLGMAISRIAGGRLTAWMEPSAIVGCACVLSIVGWALLWTSRAPVPALLGLVVLGLGIGVLYPMGVSLMSAHAPISPDRTQAVATLVGGLAAGIAPLALGSLADAVGTWLAFLVVPLFSVVGVGATLAARALTARVRSAQPPVLAP